MNLNVILSAMLILSAIATPALASGAYLYIGAYPQAYSYSPYNYDYYPSYSTYYPSAYYAYGYYPYYAYTGPVTYYYHPTAVSYYAYSDYPSYDGYSRSHIHSEYYSYDPDTQTVSVEAVNSVPPISSKLDLYKY